MADFLTPDNTMIGDSAHPAAPMAAKGVKRELLAAAAACAASGAYTYAGRINCAHARGLSLMIDYDAHASATSGRPGLIIVGSASETAPASGDDDWFVLTATDGSLTSTALGGAVPTGADYTATPNWGLALYEKLLIVPRASSAGTDEYRLALPPINVTPWRWIQ